MSVWPQALAHPVKLEKFKSQLFINCSGKDFRAQSLGRQNPDLQALRRMVWVGSWDPDCPQIAHPVLLKKQQGLHGP